ncbi:hypothetical protein CHS0354_038391 [Potamilus streckersoni]|uniref:MACPF domain-containing protein n=1 Tax=Potamilus streckersoni TaxID=2493646 RepID=A0AAE0S5W9_9BIVA|nr:hypothetical protein CHS0354_038391 [Potamilus streckersoni]
MVPDTWILLLCLVAGVMASTYALSEIYTTPNEELPPESPRRCMLRLGYDIKLFEVLPGLGWDNLQNLEMGRVLLMNYSKCQMSDDGKYLLPNDAILIPIRQSNYDMVSEVIDTMSKYTSVTSKSININTKFVGPYFSVGGSFSNEHKTVRQQLSESQSVVVRSQARFVVYKINMQPDAALHPTFRKRVLEIAKYVYMDEKQMARYLSQLLIRDFGTHVLISMEAGAAIVKEDLLDRKYVQNKTSTMDKTMLGANASVNFELLLANFDISTSVMHRSEDQNTVTNDYKQSLRHSVVRTYGGMNFGASNISTDKWVKSLDNGLVAVDKAGDPLFSFVTPLLFPELPEFTVRKTQKVMKEEILNYYKINSHRGCTNPLSFNFDMKANMDDGSCNPPSDNKSLGGLYQNCTSTETENGDLCLNDAHKNPKTGENTCPVGYKQIQLISSEVSSVQYEPQCSQVLFWKFCHGTRTLTSLATYTAYWCYTEMPDGENDSYKFGGVFTDDKPNVLTNNHSCPADYQSLEIAERVFVCVSDDYDAFDFGNVFGGFFTCQIGNPYADSKLLYSDPQSWPKGCPTNYNEHLLTVIDGCEISYCMGSFIGNGTQQVVPSVIFPPFMDAPMPENAETSFVYLHEDTNTWFQNEDALNKLSNTEYLSSAMSTYIANFKNWTSLPEWSYFNSLFSYNISHTTPSTASVFTTKISRTPPTSAHTVYTSDQPTTERSTEKSTSFDSITLNDTLIEEHFTRQTRHKLKRVTFICKMAHFQIVKQQESLQLSSLNAIRRACAPLRQKN